MSQTFTAQVKNWTELTRKNMKYVAVSAIQDVLAAAQTPQLAIGAGAEGFEIGKIPVDTAELINSLTSEGVTGPDSYITAIAGMELGDYLRFAWTAPHAMPMEMGFTAKNGRQIPGRHFVGANAAKFPEFVAARVQEVAR